MTMVAYLGLSMRRGAAVTAFSFAAFTRPTTTAATRAVTSEATSGFHHHARSAFYRQPAIHSGIVVGSTAVATDIEKSMGIEHPAFDVVKTDYVEEYGAATTLYRHKKSGAELLSVSNDDDNKVRQNEPNKNETSFWRHVEGSDIG